MKAHVLTVCLMHSVYQKNSFGVDVKFHANGTMTCIYLRTYNGMIQKILKQLICCS